MKYWLERFSWWIVCGLFAAPVLLALAVWMDVL